MRKSIKLQFIIATSLIVLGGMIFTLALASVNWNIKELSTHHYETNTYEINEDFNSIIIDTDIADVNIIGSAEPKCSVVCYEQTDLMHKVEVNSGILTVKITNTKEWYEYIGINFDTPQINVYLPTSFNGSISINTSTGEASVKDIGLKSLDISVSTGKVNISNISCDSDLSVNVTTGKLEISGAICKKFTSEGSTGSVILNRVISRSNMSVERSTGNIKLNGCDATDIFIKTNTGNVEGTLITGKSFITKTNTGHVNVPDSVGYERCEIITNTGNIKISIEK